MTHLLTLYFLDSGSYSKGYLDWFGYFFPTEYDWIHTVSDVFVRRLRWFMYRFRTKLSGSSNSLRRSNPLSVHSDRTRRKMTCGNAIRLHPPHAG